MPDTDTSQSAVLEGYYATLDPVILDDGSKLYTARQEYNEIAIDGVVLHYDDFHIEAALQRPDGTGWVLVQELKRQYHQMSDGHRKTTVERYQYPDGFYRNVTLYGLVNVT